MFSIALHELGIAFIPVNIATLDGNGMVSKYFILDTGATRTTIPKKTLVNKLGYDDDYISKNKVTIPNEQRPKMADGKRADVYKIPITRINIGGHEIQHDDYVLTSDSVAFSFLLGLDILSYFNFRYDFDAVDDKSKFGRITLEFRQSRRKDFSKLGAPFAYRLDDSQGN